MAQVGSSQRMYTALVSAAADREVAGHKVIEDPEFRSRLYGVKLRLTALEATMLRVTAASEGGKPSRCPPC